MTCRKLCVEENFKNLILSNLFERSPGSRNRSLHRNLFNVVYNGCPRLEYINKYRFPPQTEEGGGRRVSRGTWMGRIKETFLMKRSENLTVSKHPKLLVVHKIIHFFYKCMLECRFLLKFSLHNSIKTFGLSVFLVCIAKKRQNG